MKANDDSISIIKKKKNITLRVFKLTEANHELDIKRNYNNTLQ